MRRLLIVLAVLAGLTAAAISPATTAARADHGCPGGGVCPLTSATPSTSATGV